MSFQEKFRILIVDDEKTNLDVLNHILSNHYAVYIAKSGHAALKQANENRPDLILLDVVMPEMNGFDVLLQLKRNEATHRIPVIFITGLNSASNEEKGLLLGAADYIAKPFNPAIVLARIRTQLKIVEQIRIIEQLGMIDVLTGLPNKARFAKRFDAEWRRAVRESTPIGLLVIDVAPAPECVGRFSPDQNDMLLQATAEALKSELEHPMDSAAYLEENRFAVVLPNVGPDDTEDLVGKMRAAMENAIACCVDIPIPAEQVVLHLGKASTVPRREDDVNPFLVQAGIATGLPFDDAN